MTEIQEISLYEAIRTAVLEAIDQIGIEGIRELSMFPSSKRNQLNDNTVYDLANAA